MNSLAMGGSPLLGETNAVRMFQDEVSEGVA